MKPSLKETKMQRNDEAKRTKHVLHNRAAPATKHGKRKTIVTYPRKKKSLITTHQKSMKSKLRTNEG